MTTNNRLSPLLALLLLAAIMLGQGTQVTGQSTAPTALRPSVDVSHDNDDDDLDDMDEMADLGMTEEQVSMAAKMLSTGDSVMETARRLNVSDRDMAALGLGRMTGSECRQPVKECVRLNITGHNINKYHPSSVVVRRCPTDCGCVGDYKACLPTAKRNITVQLIRRTAMMHMMMGLNSTSPRPTRPGVSASLRPTRPGVSASPRPTRPSVSASPRPTRPGVSASLRPTRPSVSASPRPTRPSVSASRRPSRPRVSGAMHPTRRRRTRRGLANSLAGYGRRSRASRTPKAMRVSVQVEEHTQCSCQCRKQSMDCNQELHEYSMDNCSCVCKNTSDMENCRLLEAGGMHHWNNDKCACLCTISTTCGDGLNFSQDTCNCIPENQGLRPHDYYA